MIITNLDIYASLVQSIKEQYKNEALVIRPCDTFKSLGLDSLEIMCVECDMVLSYRTVQYWPMTHSKKQRMQYFV